MIRRSWIHWSRGRQPFYNKIGEVGGRWKTVGGKSGKHGRLISTQYFYFSDKNGFKKLSAAPNVETVSRFRHVTVVVPKKSGLVLTPLHEFGICTLHLHFYQSSFDETSAFSSASQ